MTALWSLVHRDHGPISTFLTRGDAEAELTAVIEDEPTWVNDVKVERFELAVSDGE